MGGRYEVNNSEFLSGANISVLISKEFMEAVEINTLILAPDKNSELLTSYLPPI